MSEHNPELSPEIEALIKEALNGDVEVYCKLSQKYYYGKNVEQNYHQAAFWLRKAAEQKHLAAQCNLGVMYHLGQGVEQSDKKAVQYFQLAAKRGHASAQYYLGCMYDLGKGVELNYEKAFEYYKLASEQGDERAQCNLGTMYETGRGTEIDLEKAVSLYKSASDKSHAYAQCNLGIMYEFGKGVKQDYNRAIHFYELSAKQGETRPLLNLAGFYFDGRVFNQSYFEAKKLCEKIFKDPELSFKAYELFDKTERFEQSESISVLREKILSHLKINESLSMTHYTSFDVGQAILLEQSPFRLGHISAVNDPNEGKLLWHALGYEPIEGNPVFIGCFLPKSDNLNMWRFYSKNHLNDDACGCAITFNTERFFDYRLLEVQSSHTKQEERVPSFTNTGQSPQESAAFYRVLYVQDHFEFEDDDENEVGSLFAELKKEITKFVGENPTPEKLQILAWLLGPLPYLLKDANYKDEQEHRVIVSHLDYGAKEIQSAAPDFANGTAPRLYLELHRDDHLAPIEYVTLGPKAPNKEMMAPYWRHQLASSFLQNWIFAPRAALISSTRSSRWLLSDVLPFPPPTGHCRRQPAATWPVAL
ncbi:tetratricopeptide repeat protein [Pseudoalteromonas sp. PPB1]|uniref:tetratricopeptide repeat protein n=1 Tax=Pseudoalteromonas sp. PPB1 TaxID=2756136 RepID=UPI00189187F7|nr:tetratricopeptide repeat protein [Pseudoalteromonas sp. PPB1]